MRGTPEDAAAPSKTLSPAKLWVPGAGPSKPPAGKCPDLWAPVLAVECRRHAAVARCLLSEPLALKTLHMPVWASQT